MKAAGILVRIQWAGLIGKLFERALRHFEDLKCTEKKNGTSEYLPPYVCQHSLWLFKSATT